jgi:AcrR family transcriptional regulator
MTNPAAPTKSHAKPRPKAQPNTRDRLIAAAFRVVAREGMEGASVKSIAAEAGVTPGLLHYHFPTRDALLVAALRQAQADYQDRSRRRRETATPEDLLSASFADAGARMRRDPDLIRARLAFAARALSSADFAQVARELGRVRVQETAHMLAAARRATTVTPHDRALAALIKASLDGLMLAWLSDREFPIEQATKILERAVRENLTPHGS